MSGTRVSQELRDWQEEVARARRELQGLWDEKKRLLDEISKYEAQRLHYTYLEEVQDETRQQILTKLHRDRPAEKVVAKPPPPSQSTDRGFDVLRVEPVFTMRPPGDWVRAGQRFLYRGAKFPYCSFDAAAQFRTLTLTRDAENSLCVMDLGVFEHVPVRPDTAFIRLYTAGDSNCLVNAVNDFMQRTNSVHEVLRFQQKCVGGARLRNYIYAQFAADVQKSTKGSLRQWISENDLRVSEGEMLEIARRLQVAEGSRSGPFLDSEVAYLVGKYGGSEGKEAQPPFNSLIVDANGVQLQEFVVDPEYRWRVFYRTASALGGYELTEQTHWETIALAKSDGAVKLTLHPNEERRIAVAAIVANILSGDITYLYRSPLGIGAEAERAIRLREFIPEIERQVREKTKSQTFTYDQLPPELKLV